MHIIYFIFHERVIVTIHKTKAMFFVIGILLFIYIFTFFLFKKYCYCYDFKKGYRKLKVTTNPTTASSRNMERQGFKLVYNKVVLKSPQLNK